MSWTGCQNNPIYLNFHLQKSLESFEKNSADKIWSNKNTRWKVPCPVPVISNNHLKDLILQKESTKENIQSFLSWGFENVWVIWKQIGQNGY